MFRYIARAVTGHVYHVGQVRQLNYCSVKIPELPSTPQVQQPRLFQIRSPWSTTTMQTRALQITPVCQFYARNSKVNYLDFRFRPSSCHLRSHLLIIRRQKMKKHKRIKWRKKYKCIIAKNRLKREIAKEKAFRVELLTMIRRAEQFDPREYALNKLREINSVPKEPTREERLEQLKELIREHRYQVDYIKPKHKRPEGLDTIR